MTDETYRAIVEEAWRRNQKRPSMYRPKSTRWGAPGAEAERLARYENRSLRSEAERLWAENLTLRCRLGAWDEILAAAKVCELIDFGALRR